MLFLPVCDFCIHLAVLCAGTVVIAIILFLGDKVIKRAENIDERRNNNRTKAQELMDKLKDQLELHQFLQ
ncbi:unnamed protein product, partial [Nesidiocoris tenuis]